MSFKRKLQRHLKQQNDERMQIARRRTKRKLRTLARENPRLTRELNVKMSVRQGTAATAPSETVTEQTPAHA